MKKILFSFICLSQFLFSQPDTLWTKALGGTNSDVANTVKQTVDGGFITIGSTESFGNSVELWLIKIDLQGNEVWNQTIGGSGADFGKSIGQTQDGGYIITGSTNSPEYDADDSGGATSVLLIKTDSIGVEEWYRIFNNGGGTGDQNGNSVISTSDGGYAIIGRRVSNYDTNAWVIKTDFNGVEEWNQVYGGNDHDTGNSIQQTNDNGYILCGQTDSFGNGNNDIWLIKTDSNGNEMWSQTFGGNSWEIGISVQITNDGGYIILGSTTSFGNGNSDVWLIKTDSNGNEQWNQTFGGNNSDSGYSVQQTLDNGYIISGSTQSFGNGSEDGWLIKTDFIGNEQWNQAFGGTHIDRNLSIDEISDGGFIISGYTRSFGAGDRDFWLLRVESPSYGCTDPLAFNYDPDADTEDFSCEYIGCTDDLAINFDPQATIDSGDCYYLSDIEQHFQQNWQGIPLNPMGIYLNSAILDEINLRVGDEIAVFDGSECVGIIQLTDEITSPVQIFLSEDDPDTPELDGFLSGGNISYKFLKIPAEN